MTDREILEYSKQIIDEKKELENSDSTAPDLEDQVRNKFAEDYVNRAKFIDSTLVIGGASKEFRNIFGVDAPHYELDEECYFAVDKNNNNHYEMPLFGDKEIDERIEIADPMNNNEKSRSFIDCWDLINAAKFDSTSNIPDKPNGSTKLPVDRQHFFVDSKKSDKGSPAHNPICPPGYDKWAGKVIYDYICKNFDLTETTIYNMLSDPAHNTIPSTFGLSFNGDNKFSYNIDEDGNITKNMFEYNYVGENGSSGDEYMMEAYNNDFKLPKKGCFPTDANPIKWFTTGVSVNCSFEEGKYIYEYDWNGTPFQYSRIAICSFRITKDNGKELNNGYAILAVDPKQLAGLESTGTAWKTIEQIRYCAHIIYKENTTLDSGDTQYKDKKFLWWSWTSVIPNSYKVTFNPISVLPNAVKEKLAKFVYNMEKDCLFYYNLADKRQIKVDVPDLQNSKTKIEAVLNTSKTFVDIYNGTPGSLYTAWSNFVIALRDRVLYTIYGIVENFDKTKSYQVGEPVIYNGEAYYCVQAKAAGVDFQENRISLDTSVQRGKNYYIKISNNYYAVVTPRNQGWYELINNQDYVKSSDKEINPNKTYYTESYDSETQTYSYEPVVLNPHSKEWYEIAWAKIFDNTKTTTDHETTIQYNHSERIITRWDSKYVPGWPKWLRRLFKWWSEPHYETLDSITVKSNTVLRNISYTSRHDKTTGIIGYTFPASKDLTKFFGNGNPVSVSYFYNNVLTEADRNYLKSHGEIKYNDDNHRWEIHIGPNKWKYINSSELMEVKYETGETERPPYDNIKRAQELDIYLNTNPSLFRGAFVTLSDRINKRTGTLRELCTILESTNINAQMIEQRKKNIANLFTYINAYEITGGFGSDTATIKLAAWEPYTSAYSNLERMGTVYLLADTTKIQFKDANGNPTDSFVDGTYVKTTITEIIDMISDTQYSYEVTTDNYIVPNKVYYAYNEQLAEYQEAKESELIDDNINNLYERTVSSGPIFNVTLQDKIPENFKGRNPRLVKMY